MGRGDVGELTTLAWMAGGWFATATQHEAPITVQHAQRAGLLPGPHRDPVDRMLVAESLMDDLPVVSSEERFDTYSVARVWSLRRNRRLDGIGGAAADLMLIPAS